MIIYKNHVIILIVMLCLSEFNIKDLSLLYVTKILNILKLIKEKMDNDKIEKKEIILNNLCIAIHLSLKYLMNNKKKKE